MIPPLKYEAPETPDDEMRLSVASIVSFTRALETMERGRGYDTVESERERATKKMKSMRVGVGVLVLVLAVLVPAAARGEQRGEGDARGLQCAISQYWRD